MLLRLYLGLFDSDCLGLTNEILVTLENDPRGLIFLDILGLMTQSLSFYSCINKVNFCTNEYHVIIFRIPLYVYGFRLECLNQRFYKNKGWLLSNQV